MPLTTPPAPIAPTANVRDYGAVGNGIADDTAAIQAALDTARPVFLPRGTYKITSTLDLADAGQLVGAGRGATFIDATTIGDTTAIALPSNCSNVVIRDFTLTGPNTGSSGPGGGYGIGSVGVMFAPRFDNLKIIQFSRGIDILGYDASITNCHITNQGISCISLHDGGHHYIGNTLCANAWQQANIYLWGSVQSVVIDVPLVDEGANYGVDFSACSDVIFRAARMYLNFNSTIHVGSTCSNITIMDANIVPWNPGVASPTDVIHIDAGATGVRLININTDPDGGADIVDLGTDTQYINVNGRTKHPIVAAASIPLPATVEDGQILIEDGGSGDRNLIFYAGGERYRLTPEATALNFPIGPLAITVTAPAVIAGVFSPADIANCAVWLKADAGLYSDAGQSTPAVNNGTIYWWLDQSGAVVDGSAAQGTGGLQPILKTAILNGKPVVRFDATDDALFFNNTDLCRNLSGVTIIVVAASNNVPAATRSLFSASIAGDPNTPRTILYRTAAVYGMSSRRTDADSFVGVSGGTLVEDVFSIETGVFDFAGATATLYQNGTALATNPSYQTVGTLANTASEIVSVGAAGTLVGDCDIAEVLVYQRVLTAPERSAVHSYLGTKYAITVA